MSAAKRKAAPKKRVAKKAAPKKKAAAKKAPARKPKTTGTGRPRTDPVKVASAVAAVVEDGDSVAEAARTAGVSVRVLYRALKSADVPPPAKRTRRKDEDEDDDPPILDPDASPLENAKALLEHTMKTIGKLPRDSPRMNPAHNNARAYLKLVASLQKEEAGDETPEQALERKRREDGETRKMLLRYVEEYEAQASRDGVCLHCGQPLSAELIARLYPRDKE